MKRGTTVSRQTERGQVLSRVLITRRWDLAHLADACLGCGLCADICPKEAVALAPATVAEGRLARRATPALLAEKCNFCGECVVTCPAHALALKVDGVARLPVVDGGAFPRLVAEIAVDVARCRPDCGLACAAACPVKAVAVATEGAGGRVERITAVAVDENVCFYCGKCEVACPAEGALRVAAPFAGAISLDRSLCPEGCRACADACPSGALVPDPARFGPADASAAQQMPANQANAAAGRGPAVDDRLCFYCGACARACPVPGALVVRRSRVAHTAVKSAAWTTALGKILFPGARERELESLARRRAREAALGLLGVRR